MGGWRAGKHQRTVKRGYIYTYEDDRLENFILNGIIDKLIISILDFTISHRFFNSFI